jgi:hypothetical protein
MRNFLIEFVLVLIGLWIIIPSAGACDYFCQREGRVVVTETCDYFCQRRETEAQKTLRLDRKIYDTCDYFCKRDGGNITPETPISCDYFCQREKNNE